MIWCTCRYSPSQMEGDGSNYFGNLSDGVRSVATDSDPIHLKQSESLSDRTQSELGIVISEESVEKTT